MGGGGCIGCPLFPDPDLGIPELVLGGRPDGSTRFLSSLKGSSFFGGFPLSLLGPLSRGGPLSFRAWPRVGDRELAEETGLARSAYMSSESALLTELLLEEAEETDDTLLTDKDLDLWDPERDREAEEE